MNAGAAGSPYLTELLKPRDRRRLLALDGGGIRGVITIEVLAALEASIREREKKPGLVLADWFDYVAGTSTGAIIATLVSLGLSVDDIRTFYHTKGAQMFERARWYQRFWRFKYKGERLAAQLRDIIGAAETLGSAKLKTLLLLVMRNATTDSPWPLSNNPGAKYNAPGDTSNLHFKLWQLVRASTAAPTYFPPEKLDVLPGQNPFVFVDGGVTPYNNPAFLLFLMATIPQYCLGWPTGQDRLLLVSVGTGSSPDADANLVPGAMNLLYNARKIPAALMYAALVQQDTLCRVFGECRYGDEVDSEIGDLRESSAPGRRKLFAYARYDPKLSRAGLDDVGLQTVPLAHVQQMDSAKHIPELACFGTAYAAKYFDATHLEGFFDVPPPRT